MKFCLRHLPLLVIFLFAAASAPATPPPHDYHVCITQIDHNSATQSLEITVKIFSDDLERTITTHGGPVLRLGDAKEDPIADKLIFEYLKNRMSLRVNGKAAALEWVGKEVEMDATWCYLEVKAVPNVQELEVTNRVLTELFEDQRNVMHVSAGGIRKTLYLRKELSSDALKF